MKISYEHFERACIIVSLLLALCEMETEISEVLEILRRPLPSDSVLKFIVSEDGYKRIIEDREKSNQKYRVWYDGETHKVTIDCCPSYIH
ncbi:hypothetical protein V1525DRAFT_217675 [Lipomyces kononenkoae]|uniref:Uncharacterized protein n=1 Tax=Lipomyces kononenkoae TaxID=34357 RepID=A0ACC3SXN7_LIPKO